MKGLPHDAREVLAGNKLVTCKYLHEIIVWDGYIGDGTTWIVIETYDYEHGSEYNRQAYRFGEALGWSFTWDDSQRLAVLVGDALGAKDPFIKYLTGMHLLLEGLVEQVDSECCVLENTDPNVHRSYRSFKKGEIFLFPLKRLDEVYIGPLTDQAYSVAATLSNTQKTLYYPDKLREAQQMALSKREMVVAFVCIDDTNECARMQALGDEDGAIVVFNAKLDPELEFLNRTCQKMPEDIEYHYAKFESNDPDDGYYVYRNCVLSYSYASRVSKKEQDRWAKEEFRPMKNRVDEWWAEYEEAHRPKPKKRKKSKEIKTSKELKPKVTTTKA